MLAAAAVDTEITTAINDSFASAKTFVLVTLAVAFFGLLLAITAIKVGGKWVSKTLNK